MPCVRARFLRLHHFQRRPYVQVDGTIGQYSLSPPNPWIGRLDAQVWSICSDCKGHDLVLLPAGVGHSCLHIG
jgi:hypothetical protein